MSQKIGPIYARQDYAGFIRRTLALAFDFLLLLLLYLVVASAWYFLAPWSWQTDRAARWISAGLLLAWWAYMMGMRLSMKGTLGYRLLRIRYACMLNEKPTLLAIAFRSVVAAALMIVFFAVDHLWILCDKRKQAWHDKLSGFYVVKTRACPLGTTPVVRRVVTIMGLTFMFWEPANDELPPPYAKGLAPVAPPTVRVQGHEQA